LILIFELFVLNTIIIIDFLMIKLIRKILILNNLI